jgi:hypothetical protein
MITPLDSFDIVQTTSRKKRGITCAVVLAEYDDFWRHERFNNVRRVARMSLFILLKHSRYFLQRKMSCQRLVFILTNESQFSFEKARKIQLISSAPDVGMPRDVCAGNRDES